MTVWGIIRRAAVGVGLAITLAGFAAAPAAAAEATAVAQTVQPRLESAQVVTGEPWSAPDQPVDCTRTDARISCWPELLPNAKAERCFDKVQVGSELLTVCTTYEGNVSAIKGDGGNEIKLEYGCQIADAVCTIGEQFGRASSSLITGGISWVMENITFTTSTALWETVRTEWAWWAGIGVGITLIIAIIGVSLSLWEKDATATRDAIVRSCFAVPLSMLSFWFIGWAVNIADGFTQGIITRDNGESLYLTVQNMIFGGGGGNWLLAQTVIVLLLVAVIVLVFVFAARNILLAAVIAFGPLAFVAFPARFGRQWVIRWIGAVTALVLTTPLTMGFLMLVLRAMGNVGSVWTFQALPMGVGLILVALAPASVFAIFAFTAGHGSAGGDEAAGRVFNNSRTVMSMGQQVWSKSQSARNLASRHGGGGGGSGVQPRTQRQPAPSSSGGSQPSTPAPSGGRHPAPAPAQTPARSNPAPAPAPAPSSPRTSAGRN